MNEVNLKSLWKELDVYQQELEKETKALEEVWVKIVDLKKKNEEDAQSILSKTEFDFLEPERELTFNIGGQIFNVSVEILTRDPYSLLAACCRKKPIVVTDVNQEGTFYFERDWWLFRHILAFLRSNILPNELDTLKELYTEASFYRLESLLKAIESVPLDQINTNTLGPIDANNIRRIHSTQTVRPNNTM